MSATPSPTVDRTLDFIPRTTAGGQRVISDLRTPVGISGNSESVEVEVTDARAVPGLSLATSGFELVYAPTGIVDFYDCDLVMREYYTQCKALAARLTGAHTTFTFDHIIREPGLQYDGGGIDGKFVRSDVTRGGGHIGAVHMDYTDRTSWDAYLALHGESAPADAQRVMVLNFWRPVSECVDDNPLAICDARTVVKDDLLEVDVYGYGAQNYSWHEIGIETFSVSASPRHKWYYYPEMTPDDVLLIKSFDSQGVIGNTCPHGSFTHPNPKGVPRRSIELRVLCFC